VLSFHNSLAKSKEAEETCPPMNSNSNSSDSNSLDTIDSQDNKSADNDVDLYNDTNENTEIKESSNNVIMSDNCDDGIIAEQKRTELVSGVVNDSVENTENSIIMSHMYEFEPCASDDQEIDYLSVPLDEEVFVSKSFQTNEDNQFCFNFSNKKLNVILSCGDFYPSRGIFAFAVYKSTQLSTIRFVFINEKLDKFSSITWKYFLSLGIVATQRVKSEVNF
jgi:hypothetical protein